MQYARKLFTNQNIELTKKKHTKYIIYALQRNKFTKITMMPRRIFEISKEPKIQMFSLFRWWLVLHLHVTSGVWKRKRCGLEKSVKTFFPAKWLYGNKFNWNWGETSKNMMFSATTNILTEEENNYFLTNCPGESVGSSFGRFGTWFRFLAWQSYKVFNFFYWQSYKV